MRARLRAHAAAQGGPFTRQQAIDAGYSLSEIRALTRVDGPWVILRRGVYAERQVAAAADTWEKRMLLRDHAAHLTVRRPHLMSHDSAARIIGLPMLRPRVPLVHLTRFGVGGSRTTDGVKHHLTRIGLLGTEQHSTMRVTGLTRTALDIAREHGHLAGLVACDAALQRGVELADFVSELNLMWCWPHITSARSAVQLADRGAESIGETLLRDVLMEADIGPTETQFPVRVGRSVFWCDLRVGRHFFEFDGLLKYLRREAGGLSDKQISEIVWDEKRRQDRICALQVGMSRVTWDELFGSRRTALVARLRAEYQATTALFGEQLPPAMTAFAAAHRHERLGGRTRRTPA